MVMVVFINVGHKGERTSSELRLTLGRKLGVTGTD